MCVHVYARKNEIKTEGKKENTKERRFYAFFIYIFLSSWNVQFAATS